MHKMRDRMMSKVYSCEDCLAYSIHKKLNEPGRCPNCGKRTREWKQSCSGTFYLFCSNCSDELGVDMNTPCEEDPVFRKNVLNESDFADLRDRYAYFPYCGYPYSPMQRYFRRRKVRDKDY